MGRPPTIKELKEAHAAESEQISRRIADGDNFPEAGRLWKALAQRERSDLTQYVTGITALNIPIPSRVFADWHSYGLANVHAWSRSGTTLIDTSHLLGMTGVYDATEALRRYAPDTTTGTLAATYERAVFDLLYHSAMTGKPVPNIQAKDIDDSVDFDLVKSWIRSADILTEDRKATMIDWFTYCD